MCRTYLCGAAPCDTPVWRKHQNSRFNEHLKKNGSSTKVGLLSHESAEHESEVASQKKNSTATRVLLTFPCLNEHLGQKVQGQRLHIAKLIQRPGAIEFFSTRSCRSNQNWALWLNRQETAAGGRSLTLDLQVLLAVKTTATRNSGGWPNHLKKILTSMFISSQQKDWK